MGCAGGPSSLDSSGDDAQTIAPGAAAKLDSDELDSDELAFFEAALHGVEFSFHDPLTMDVHTASGPYKLVTANQARVEFAGYDDNFGRARLILFLKEDRLWAHVSIEGQEYLTRIQ